MEMSSIYWPSSRLMMTAIAASSFPSLPPVAPVVLGACSLPSLEPAERNWSFIRENWTHRSTHQSQGWQQCCSERDCRWWSSRSFRWRDVLHDQTKSFQLSDRAQMKRSAGFQRQSEGFVPGLGQDRDLNLKFSQWRRLKCISASALTRWDVAYSTLIVQNLIGNLPSNLARLDVSVDHPLHFPTVRYNKFCVSIKSTNGIASDSHWLKKS